ncbi:MAG: efflux RND transporter periplasmic adaptor subunit [bacterium]|nr:efflux RND transporter periplasmic adaptor subunit [bacterium]MDY2831088.1 efflux RND transporter periplasmic adaptor subunit [Alphaproteobacteria bacterium]
MSKKLLFSCSLAVLAVVSCLGVSSCKKEGASYQTERIAQGDIVQKITASGIINPISTVDIGTQVSGIISEIYVDYNSEVKKGDLLALIDPQTFEATVSQRQAALDIAKAELEVTKNNIVYYKKHLDRIKKLNTSKYSADKELESAQRDYDNSVAEKALKTAQVKQAEASLKQAQIDLEYTRITSSVDGVVISREVEVGQTVAASFNTPTLFNVAEDLTKMQIEASVVEADIAKVKEGQKVEFSVDSFPDEIFEGVVTQVRNNPITTSNVVTYQVIIGIDNKDLKLKPGMTANVDIITAQKQNVLLVPNKALRFYTTDEKGEVKRYKDKGVWILKDKKPVRINVTTGVSDDDKTEISSREIKAGDEVILEDKNAELAKEQMRMRMPR